MAATLRIGSTEYDLYFLEADSPPLTDHLRDVATPNRAYRVSALALPPEPIFPAPRLNVLTFPVTGLSHPAVGHLLVLADTAATTGTTCTLKLTDDEADSSRDFSLTILNRRPLSDTRSTLDTDPSGTPESPSDAWILTVVDSRYLRRKAVASSDTIARSTWGELINALGSAAGFTMQSAATIQALVHADFGTPDTTAWSPATLAGEGYSVAADSAALACGLRLVVSPTGTVTAQTAATSGTAYSSWLTATGRDNFEAGGVSKDRYAAPRNVLCNGSSVAMPSPTTRLTDTDAAELAATGGTFRAKWVETYSDWLAATHPTCDIRGFVLPPVCGVVQHVEYDLPGGWTRVVKHPARYPLPLLRARVQASSGGSALDTRNSDNSDQITATTKIIASLPDGLEFVKSGTENTLKGLAASKTQKGMVTVGAQDWTGQKASYDSPTEVSGFGVVTDFANYATTSNPSANFSFAVYADGVDLTYTVVGNVLLVPAKYSGTNWTVGAHDNSPIIRIGGDNSGGTGQAIQSALFNTSSGNVFAVGNITQVSPSKATSGVGAGNRFGVIRTSGGGTDILYNGADASTGGLTFVGGLYIGGTLSTAVGSLTGLGSGVATFLATPSSATLAGAITDGTGTGALVFANAPTLVDPDVGTQTPGDNSTKAASTAYVDNAVATATAGTTVSLSYNAATNELTVIINGVSATVDLSDLA